MVGHLTERRVQTIPELMAERDQIKAENEVLREAILEVKHAEEVRILKSLFPKNQQIADEWMSVRRAMIQKLDIALVTIGEPNFSFDTVTPRSNSE